MRGRGLFSSVAHRLWAVVHEYDAIESLQAPPQVEVNFALDVHKDEARHQAEGHNAKLGPEKPLQLSCNIEGTQGVNIALVMQLEKSNQRRGGASVNVNTGDSFPNRKLHHVNNSLCFFGVFLLFK